MVEKVNISEETSRHRSGPGKKIKGQILRRIHKAQREKMKREHLNELFFSLANALELCEQTNGKASILSEATRLLKHLLRQIESLKKENASLLSESLYVAMEKNELKEENSSLETQIEKLQGEIEERVIQSKPDPNVPPVLELQQPEQTVEPSSEQGPAVLVPFRRHLQAAFSAPDIPGLPSKPTCIVSKPHPRYPTPADTWPLQLLGQQPTSG